MRRTIDVLFFSTLLIAVTGCGDGAGNAGSGGTVAEQGVGPHGGSTVALGDVGFAEAVAESPAGQSSQVVAVYFFAPDQITPLATLPTSVSLEVQLGSGPATITLRPAPGSGPADKTRFEGKPSSPLDDRLSGKLTVTLDGATHEATISPY
jgi:hypothetical protein